jgi:hypothetical protein
MDNHEKIYDVLLEMKSDIGGIKSDVSGICKRLDTMNGKVAEHEKFILNWQGKLGFISALVGASISLLVLWLKEKLKL